MEKLFVIYKDKTKYKAECRQNGVVVEYFNRLPKSFIETAYIQKYPKKDNAPVVLVKAGVLCVK